MNRKKKFMIVIALVLLLCLSGLFAIRPAQRGFRFRHTLGVRTIQGANVTETECRSILGGLSRTERSYTIENGDTVLFGRVQAQNQASAYHMVRTDLIACEQATVWYYDYDTEQWCSDAITEQTIGTTCLYIDGDCADYYAYLPIGYTPLENNALELTGSKGYATIEKCLKGWKVRMYAPNLTSGDVCDYTVVQSQGDENLLDFSNENIKKLWATYCNNGDGKWCYDGYYFPSPDTYIPTGVHCLYRCVAAYFARSMTDQANASVCAYDLSLAILDTMSLQQNSAGYFPSTSGSTWLNEDYGIEPGYYDTRFNSDLMGIYYQQMTNFGGFSDVVNQYFDFYLSHCENAHYETERGGWLVWDYSPSASAVHCSLNHQLSEILMLYRFGSLLNRPELTQLADRMLTAVEDTCDDWIMDDSNLHYCRMPDGSYGKQDYPYLTYNDLYNLQEELLSMGRSRNAALDTLMEAKLIWMQNNGITGYHS